jgi:hypothetical protein
MKALVSPAQAPPARDTKIAASFRVPPTSLGRRDRVSRFGSSG